MAIPVILIFFKQQPLAKQGGGAVSKKILLEACGGPVLTDSSVT
jgi:hypothetical protein